MVQPAAAAALVQTGKKAESKLGGGRDAEIFRPRARNFPRTRGLGRPECFRFEILKRWHFAPALAAHAPRAPGPPTISL